MVWVGSGGSPGPTRTMVPWVGSGRSPGPTWTMIWAGLESHLDYLHRGLVGNYPSLSLTPPTLARPHFTPPHPPSLLRWAPKGFQTPGNVRYSLLCIGIGHLFNIDGQLPWACSLIFTIISKLSCYYGVAQIGNYLILLVFSFGLLLPGLTQTSKSECS